MPRASVSAVGALAALVACGAASTPAASPSSGASGQTQTEAARPTGPPSDVDCGDFSTCATSTDGAARCWGKDNGGQLGDGGGTNRDRPVTLASLGKVVKTALASRFGCAVLQDKTVKCWGSGKIANDGKALTNAGPTPVAGVDGVVDLVASGVIACARSASSVWCWGADASTIGAVPKGDFAKIAVGFTHACALDATGAPTCWGSGDWDGKGAYARPAVKGAVEIATGDRHACVVSKDRKVLCWGQNDAGQLGIKADGDTHKKAVTVPTLSDVEKIVAGEASTCAVRADGSVTCWGQNGEGELGLGSRTSYERPTKATALGSVQQLCLASSHGCALTKQAKLVCWGANGSGQIGDGTKERRLEATPVAW